jgi:Ca-activated chloride channel homolog
MFYLPALKSKAPRIFPRRFLRSLLLVAAAFLLGAWIALDPPLTVGLPAHAQSTQAYERELSVSAKSTLTIRNRNGRVSVITLKDDKAKASLQATSPGAPVVKSDVTVADGEISVRERRPQDRIDLTIRVPPRTRVKVESESGMVDVIGDFASAEVLTDTGTIHADVPLDAVKFKFLWQASHPRFLSDVELPKVKEGRAGSFSISGRLGANAKKTKKNKKEPAREAAVNLPDPDPNSVQDGTETEPADDKNTNDKKKQPKQKAVDNLVQLDLTTQRGVILLNVDPSMVPNDLRERPLTEAAKAIVRSGDGPLSEAIRKVSPRLFGDYAKSMPPPRTEPSLVTLRPPGEVATSVTPQLMRVNASVTDRNGRAIAGMRSNDFTIFEDGAERQIKTVTPATEPFNLILLLDVSGSVEERIDFIRKAARDFLKTASPQDRISIISFRDDIQVISDFTTDRGLLSRKLEDIDAGGATALYDALSYSLVDTLRPLRGERTAIVILSDGDDNKSFVPFPAILEAIIESGALIYPLYVPSGLIPESSVPRPTVTVDPTRTRYLTITTRAAEEGEKLASVSGGVFYSIKRLEDLQKAYDDVVAQLRTAYTITYSSNGTGHRRIRVRTNRDGASVRLSPAVNAPN